jgi:ATP-binding cassette, subfamily B, bacterial
MTTAPTTSPAVLRDIPKTPLRFAWHFIRRGYMGGLVTTILASLIVAGVEAGGAVVFGALINALGDSRSAAAPASLAKDPAFLFALMVGMWLTPVLVQRLNGVYLGRYQSYLRAHIHDQLLGYVLGHAPRFFLDEGSGSVGHRVRTVALTSYYMIDFLGFRLLRFIALLAIALSLAATQMPSLVPVFVVFVVACATLSFWGARLCWPYGRTLSSASSAQSGRKVDIIANWDTILSFAGAGIERRDLRPYSDREARAKIRWVDSTTALGGTMHVISLLLVIGVGWLGLKDTLAGDMTIGAFATAISLSLLIASHLAAMSDHFLNFSEQYTQLQDGLAVIAQPHEIVDQPNAQPLRVTSGRIEIRDLRFGYTEDQKVFDGLSLTIKSGERVGLVGPSGAGKSTLVKLLRRQFPWQGGDVFIDGQNSAGVTWQSLHEAMAEVPQSPTLFHRSVRDNILYGRPDATEADMLAAAQKAHCHEFVTAREKGYDAVVGERGMKLSGGEKQRIAIARAFLKNAPILILDEATSSLDSHAENLIQEALLQLMTGRTVIAIAHRLSTIMHLDRIVVLDGGRIVEQGRHTELLNANGAYARLWKHQAGGFI